MWRGKQSNPRWLSYGCGRQPTAANPSAVSSPRRFRAAAALQRADDAAVATSGVGHLGGDLRALVDDDGVNWAAPLDPGGALVRAAQNSRLGVRVVHRDHRGARRVATSEEPDRLDLLRRGARLDRRGARAGVCPVRHGGAWLPPGGRVVGVALGMALRPEWPGDRLPAAAVPE